MVAFGVKTCYSPMVMTSTQVAPKGHVIVVMAPTGSGKGTIVGQALKSHSELYHTVSCTSRPIRPGEIDGVNYHFLTLEEFDKRVTRGDFLEWAEFAGNKYGTLKSEILPRLEAGQIVLLEIEVQGVEQLFKLLPREQMTIVYIEAGGWDVLESRVTARAPVSPAELERRYQRFLIEVEAKPLADIIINNRGEVESAHAEFEKVILSVKSKQNK
jgi:guanylate kinase